MVKRKKIQVEFKEAADGKRFPYVDIGSETHGRKSFRLWVSGRLLIREGENYTLVFPVQGGKIEKTKNGNFVLRPNEAYIVYYIYVPCGYRGLGTYEILSPRIDDNDIFPFKVYSSQRGSLGSSHGALVNVPSGQVLKYRWKRTGRLYGASDKGITCIHPDGQREEFDLLQDGLASIDELSDLAICDEK